VKGTSRLPTGFQLLVVNGYVGLDRVLTEAAVGTVTVGGLAYGVYVVAESASDRE
jgi:hypothetical protein